MIFKRIFLPLHIRRHFCTQIYEKWMSEMTFSLITEDVFNDFAQMSPLLLID